MKWNFSSNSLGMTEGLLGSEGVSYGKRAPSSLDTDTAESLSVASFTSPFVPFVSPSVPTPRLGMRSEGATREDCLFGGTR